MNCLAKSSQGNIYIMNKIVICKMLIVRTTWTVFNVTYFVSFLFFYQLSSPSD
jgi:hypothetical protein